ncbi:cytochrome c peroxidase [Tenacibaculum sp. HL-MS23]|uniref:cytochrome-c peroxidase n=1 Tax=Tenacibaculum sp. HL-MS23 TaxID=3077734 RepID=UPI0028FC3040|nr:cytochrome c peroxidase [Tenacibaculum sp. HL-MS23]WNW01291.1 cytochrome c peroxidase [Tenacibaculum sp. HL-MS23]
MKKLIQLVICTFVIVSCNNEENYLPVSKIDTQLSELLFKRAGNSEKSYFILPSSNDYSKIPQDPKNPITEAKVILGKLLFHETALAQSPKHTDGIGTYSCASCHHAKAGFQSCKKQAIGDGGFGFGASGEIRTMAENYTNEMVDVQPIKSPTILNSAYQKVTLWNGQFGATGMNINTQAQWTTGTPKETNNLGFEGLETQAIAGLTVHRLEINSSLIENLGYKTLFDDAFANVNEEKRYTFKNAGLAIAAYERTVIANEAPFQEWLKGDLNAMTNTEKKGAILFFDKGKCYQCHSGPSLNSMDFIALGMKDLEGGDILGSPVDEATKKGRGGFTQNTNDNYKFKVPQLYSVKYNGFYGHGSSFTSIKEIIAYKNNGIKENQDVPDTSLDTRFKPLNLSEEEVNLITLFVEKSLDDKNLKRYTPERVLSDNCIPNNDVQSQEDICN